MTNCHLRSIVSYMLTGWFLQWTKIIQNVRFYRQAVGNKLGSREARLK